MISTPIRCLICPDHYHTDDQEDHLLGHDYLAFRCQPCQRQSRFSPLFLDLDDILQHLRQKHDITEKESLLQIEFPWDLRSIQCSECEARFLSRGTSALHEHYVEEHGHQVGQHPHDFCALGRLQCRFCAFEAESEMHWKKHFQRDHRICSGMDPDIMPKEDTVPTARYEKFFKKVEKNVLAIWPLDSVSVLSNGEDEKAFKAPFTQRKERP